jgi:hypothetical protein
MFLDKCWQLTDQITYKLISSNESKPFENENPDFLDSRVNTSYSKDNKKWTHKEFVIHLSIPTIIEPDYSCAIVRFNKIFQPSVFSTSLKPSFPRYILSFFKKKRRYEKAIIFDGYAGANYFHFFSDVFHKTWMFEEIIGYEKIPIIISEKIYHKKYFQYILKNTELSKLDWVIQKTGEYISVKETWFLKPMPYKYEYFKKTKQLLIGKPETNDDQRKLFLNRSNETGRYINNFDEIRPILKKYNFEIIDSNDESMEWQISTFQSAKYLISIHGAGQTNIIFSDEQLRFLEINPENRISCQYYWLSKILNIEYYDVILGGKLPFTNQYPEKGFYLDPFKFEKAIELLLSRK